MFEHIEEDKLANVLQNVKKHMHMESYFIGSISKLPYEDFGKGITYHVTLKNDDWWNNFFTDNGFKLIDKRVLAKYDYVRGNKGYFEDEWDYFDKPFAGYHFVLKKNEIT